MKEARNEIIELVSKMEKRNAEASGGAGGLNGTGAGDSGFGSGFMSSRAYIDDDDDGVQYPGSEQ